MNAKTNSPSSTETHAPGLSAEYFRLSSTGDRESVYWPLSAIGEVPNEALTSTGVVHEQVGGNDEADQPSQHGGVA